MVALPISAITGLLAFGLSSSYKLLWVLPRVYNKRGECRTPNITNDKCIRKVT